MHVDVATEPAIVEEPKPTVVATPVQSPVQIKAHTSKYNINTNASLNHFQMYTRCYVCAWCIRLHIVLK